MIKITAIDTDGILAEENITITREKDYVGVPNSNIFFPTRMPQKQTASVYWEPSSSAKLPEKIQWLFFTPAIL